MDRSPATRTGVAFLAIAVIAMACSSSGPSASAGAAGSAASTGTSQAAATATPASSPSTTAAAATPDPSVEAAAPPAASLSVDGGEPVTGQLGSYTWNGGGSDSPWLPGTPITIGSGERPSASLDGGAGTATWSARRVAAGSSDGAGAIGLGDGSGPIAFAGPPPGRWSVQLTVHFAGDRGSATYYWDVSVR